MKLKYPKKNSMLENLVLGTSLAFMNMVLSFHVIVLNDRNTENSFVTGTSLAFMNMVISKVGRRLLEIHPTFSLLFHVTANF